MNIKKVSDKEFANSYGSKEIINGPFDYFDLKGKVGIRKDTRVGSIDVINLQNCEDSFTASDDKEFLDTVCGNFIDNWDIPKFKNLYEYESEERKSRYLMYLIYGISSSILIASVIWYILVF